jgi:hypothetical protein
MPLTSPENLTGTTEFLQWLQVITDGRFGPALLIMFSITIFLTMKVYDTERAWAAAFFVSALLGLFLGALGLLPFIWRVGVFIAFLVGLAGIVWRD